MGRQILLVIGAIIAVSVPLVVGAGAPGMPRGKVVASQVSGPLAVGKMAYDVHCASCHGTNGVGTDKGPPMLHRYYHRGHHGDGAFFIAAKRGVRQHHWKFGDMKPVPAATDAQLANIVKYVRELQRVNGLF